MVRSLTAFVGFMVAVVVAGACPVASAQSAGKVTPAQEAAIEAGIKELSTQWSKAILEKDATILERIWAPDFTFVEPSGARFTRAEGIADLKAGKDLSGVNWLELVSMEPLDVQPGEPLKLQLLDFLDAIRTEIGRAHV